MEDVWPTARVTELCLQLTASSRPCELRWAPTQSRRAERGRCWLWGRFTFFFQSGQSMYCYHRCHYYDMSAK